jgi:protein phosphatase PTC7
MVTDDNRLIMVADGVGGWGDLDVCSGVFSRFLTSTVKKLYTPTLPLKNLLVEAVKLNPHDGSSTAVLARLSDDQLETCNLGDSAYLIVRQGETSYRS